MSIDPARTRRFIPVPPHMPVVVVLPAGSRALLTPGGDQVEALVLRPWALIDRPIHIEDAGRITGRITSPPNRSPEGRGVGCRAQRQVERPRGEGDFFWCFIRHYECRVEVSKDPCTRKLRRSECISIDF